MKIKLPFNNTQVQANLIFVLDEMVLDGDDPGGPSSLPSRKSQEFISCILKASRTKDMLTAGTGIIPPASGSSVNVPELPSVQLVPPAHGSSLPISGKVPPILKPHLSHPIIIIYFINTAGDLQTIPPPSSKDCWTKPRQVPIPPRQLVQILNPPQFRQRSMSF